VVQGHLCTNRAMHKYLCRKHKVKINLKIAAAAVLYSYAGQALPILYFYVIMMANYLTFAILKTRRSV
jgi:hypothetical protein